MPPHRRLSRAFVPAILLGLALAIPAKLVSDTKAHEGNPTVAYYACSFLSWMVNVLRSSSRRNQLPEAMLYSP